MTPGDIKVAPRPAEPKRPDFSRKMAPRYAKGEVWVVSESPDHPPVGTEMWANRPAVIVSNDVMNQNSGFALVVYLTTSTTKLVGPTHIEVASPGSGQRALALCEQVHTVDVSRLRARKGALDWSSVREIDNAIALTLSLGRQPKTNAVFAKWENYIKTHGINMRQAIEALSAKTTDDRVAALVRALEHTAAERDAYRTLYETTQNGPAIAREVLTSISSVHQHASQNHTAAAA